MKSRKPRTIRIGQIVYLWRVHHRHRPASPNFAHCCAEVFTAFAEGAPRRPARILFPETDEHGPGFPSQSGVVVDYREPTRYINLNRPRIARLLIELAVVSGWALDRYPGEHVIPNGYHLLREHRAELLAALAEGDVADPG